MIEQSLPEESIFLSALELESAAERAIYLDQACGDNVKLRAEVEALLRANLKSGDLLDLNESPDETIDRPIAEQPGTVIGPYKLLQQIGEGGMGVVFMAEQSEPIQRTVALKIIKPGMDTRQVIARFEAERQALAVMDHPNIAKVLDAGTTDTGRPYFVMELVKGVPITKYCDEKQLSLSERLELFMPVCQAVQHAHQKGIIHRDIKPTNVLVAEYDNRAVPKVIDFGVAKATAQKLTERTMFTEFGQVVGTVEYMSPEQAKLNQLDIDTRSDIYSLGVLLYELLAGSTPFEQKRLREAAFDEVLRIIREEEPPKPSTRLSSSDTLPSIAANRHAEPARLSKEVRGELDWIVMKCLEKDRNRRYETANGLANDLQRYLADEPVQACPPSAAYRLKKFIRRNKMAAMCTGAVATLLVALVVTLAVTNARIRRESDARAAALKAKEASLATTRQALQQLNELETDIAERLTEIPGGEPIYRAMKEDTLRRLEPILKQAEIDGETTYESFVILEIVAYIQCEFGRYEEARQAAERGIDVVQKTLDTDPDNPVYLSDLCRAKSCLVDIMFQTLTSENEGAFVDLCNQLLELKRDLNRRHPERTEPTSGIIERLGKVALRHGDRDTAERLFREGVALAKVHIGQKHSQPLARESACVVAMMLGDLLRRDSAADAGEAAAMYEQALLWAQGGLNVSRARALRNLVAIAELRLGLCRFEQDRIEEAIPLVQHAAAESRRLSRDFPSDLEYLESSLRAQDTLIRLLQQSGRADESNVAAGGMADLLDGAQSLLAGPADTAAASRRPTEVYFGAFAQLRANAMPEDTLGGIAISYVSLAHYFASAHRDQEAAEFVRKAVSNTQRLTDPAASANALYHIALMQLRLGDKAGYRATCKALVNLPDYSADDASESRAIWTLCLAPDAQDDLPLHVKRAEEYLAKVPQGQRHLGLYLLGAAHYRARQYNQAAQRLEEAIAAFPTGSLPATHSISYLRLILAMTKWQLGERDEARRQFAETKSAVDKEIQAPTTRSRRRTTLELLRAEAEGLIGQKEADEAVENKNRPDKESSSNSVEQARHEKK